MSQDRSTTRFRPTLEDFSGPVLFAWDSIWFAAFCGLVYISLLTTPPPHPWYAYLMIGLAFAAMQHICSSTRNFYVCFASSDILRDEHTHKLELVRAFSLLLTCWTGIRPTRIANAMTSDKKKKHLPGVNILNMFGVLIESAVTFLLLFLRPLAFGAFVGFASFFVLEIAYNNPYDPWMNTQTTYPQSMYGGCDIFAISEGTLKLFFDATNDPFVIDALLALDGFYLNMLTYRTRARIYYQIFRPALVIICNGADTNAQFDHSVIACCAAVVLAIILAMTPFAFFRDAQHLFANIWVWIIAVTTAAVMYITVFYVSDLPIMLPAYIIPGSTYQKTTLPAGTTATIALAGMGGSALLMCGLSRSTSLYKTNSTEVDVIDTSSSPVDRLESIIWAKVRKLFRILLSQGVILAVVALGAAFLMGQYGVPVTDIQFVQIPKTQPYPSWMAPNYVESAFLNFTSIEDTVTRLVTQSTRANYAMIGNLLSSVVDALTAGTNIGLGSLVNLGVQDMAGLFITAEIDSIHLLFDAINYLPISTLDHYIASVVDAIFLEKYLEDAISAAEGVLALIPSIVPYIPVALVGAMLAVTAVGVFMPAIASFIQMSVLIGTAQLVLGVIGLFLSVRLLLLQYNYNVVLTFKDGGLVLALDAIALILVFVSCALLIEVEQKGLAEEEAVTKLVTEFETDMNIHAERIQLNRMRHRVVVVDPPPPSQTPPLPAVVNIQDAKEASDSDYIAMSSVPLLSKRYRQRRR